LQRLRSSAAESNSPPGLSLSQIVLPLFLTWLLCFDLAVYVVTVVYSCRFGSEKFSSDKFVVSKQLN